MVRLLRVAELIAAEHLGDLLFRRIRVEHQIDLGLRFGVFTEGVVQQVVKNLPIHFRAFAVFGFKGFERRAFRRVDEAEPDRQPAQLDRVARDEMRLQVEHDLQAMCDAAVKA